MQKKFASLTMIHTSVSSNYRNVLLTDTSVPTNFSEGKTKLWTNQRRPVTDHPRPQLPHHCQWIWCLLTVKLSINHDPKTGPECPIVEKDWVSMSEYFDFAFCFTKQWFEMMIYNQPFTQILSEELSWSPDGFSHLFLNRTAPDFRLLLKHHEMSRLVQI